MYRATTPTITIKVPDVDMTQATNLVATIRSNRSGNSFNKFMDDLNVSEHEVAIFLTQEESLMLPVGDVSVMLNWLYNEGTTTKRACTEEVVIKVKDNLFNEVWE